MFSIQPLPWEAHGKDCGTATASLRGSRQAACGRPLTCESRKRLQKRPLSNGVVSRTCYAAVAVSFIVDNHGSDVTVGKGTDLEPDRLDDGNEGWNR